VHRMGGQVARMRLEADVPAGTRLGVAQDDVYGKRGLLFDEDTGKLVGHATLYEVDDELGDDGSYSDESTRDEDEDDEAGILAEILAEVLFYLAVKGVEAAAPHVEAWWKAKAAPTLKRRAVPAIKAVPGKVKAAPARVKAVLKRTSGSTPAEVGHASAGMVTIRDADTSATAKGQVLDVEVRRPVMSSSEAGERLSQAVAAMAFAREQMLLIYGATILDDEGRVALAGMLDELSPQDLEGAIRTVLLENPRMLERSTSAGVAVSLG